MTKDPDALTWIATFLDELPVGVWVARASSGEFVYANRAFEIIMGMRGLDGVSAGEYAAPYGIHALDGSLYPEERMPFVQALRARTTVEVDDIVIHRRDGGRVYIRAFARPLFDAAGAMTHIVIAFTDKSREVEAERQRAEGEARLHHIQRMESIGNLAGGIAHDFNNLLAAVKMLASQLRLDERDAAKLRLLDQLDHATDSAANLTRGLLGFARRGKHRVQPVALHELLQRMTDLASRTIDRRIEVTSALGAARDVVLGDPGQIEQVVMNLVINARDAIPGAGAITLRTTDAALPDGRPALVLDVVDTGGGIAPAIRHRIFEPYFTTRTTGPNKGTGFGLATAYGIVENHGGSLEVHASGPGGTTMRVTLPAAPLDAEPTRPTPPAPPPSLRPGRGTLLLVEDEEQVREATASGLHAVGYEVLTAEDGVRAVEIFRRHADVALVILDMIMPRMGGHETYLALRAIDPAVCVLLTTGFALNEQAQAILDLGVRGFLAKPYDLATLTQEVARLLAAPAATPS